MLHIINKSPQQSASLATCLRFAKAQDAILLIEDAVYATIETDLAALLKNIPEKLIIYALKEDMQIRGIAEELNNNIQVIDYADFVELTLTHHPTQTWS